MTVNERLFLGGNWRISQPWPTLNHHLFVWIVILIPLREKGTDFWAWLELGRTRWNDIVTFKVLYCTMLCWSPYTQQKLLKNLGYFLNICQRWRVLKLSQYAFEEDAILFFLYKELCNNYQEGIGQSWRSHNETRQSMNYPRHSHTKEVF